MGNKIHPPIEPISSRIFFYRDVPAALDGLARAFGFTEEMQQITPRGMHTQMALDGSRIMMRQGSEDWRMQSPRDASVGTMEIFFDLAGANAHHERACAAGAEIVQAPLMSPTAEPTPHVTSTAILDFFTTPQV